MNSCFKVLTLFTVVGLFMAGCAGSKSKVPADQYSGYLDDYSALSKSRDVTGESVLRWVSPELKRSGYTKIIIEPIEFFPQPQPTEQVSEDTLVQIKVYFTQALRREAAKTMDVVDQPGPGVVRLRLALTAVGTETENLKAYQYIPVALVVTAAHSAVSGRPVRANVFFEAELLDSQSGEKLAIHVRGGLGERLEKIKGSGRVLTLDSVKPLMDEWSELIGKFLEIEI